MQTCGEHVKLHTATQTQDKIWDPGATHFTSKRNFPHTNIEVSFELKAPTEYVPKSYI